MASRHGAIIDALETLIAATLTGEAIHKRVLPVDRSLTLSTSATTVILSPAPEQEVYTEGTSNTQTWEYPVVVTLAKPANQSVVIDDALLEDRQKVRQRLNRRPLSAVTGVPRMRVEPGPVILSESWESRNVLVSILTVYAWSVEDDT